MSHAIRLIWTCFQFFYASFLIFHGIFLIFSCLKFCPTMEVMIMVIRVYQIRLQLETLLAEKARLAQENSVLTRENRFLREIVEYHQLTMQDVVYLDETNEEVTEVYPIKVHASTNLLLFNSTLLSSSAHLFLQFQIETPQVPNDLSSHPVPSPELTDASHGVSSYIPAPSKNGLGRYSKPFS